MEARTSMGWTEHTLEYYAEINLTRYEFSTGILCALRFKTGWEIIQCCHTSRAYKGFGPADLNIYAESAVFPVKDCKVFFFYKHH